MARRGTESDRVKRWQARIDASTRRHQEWDDRYQCQKLWEYYCSKQVEDPDNQYVINLFFPTIEIKMPSMMFNKPKIRATPIPAREETPASELQARAQLLEDIGQHLASHKRSGFIDAAKLAIKESFFRYGAVEIGYGANYIDNPNADKPILKEGSESPMKDASGADILEPPTVLEKGSEYIYVRHIPAKNFRFPVESKPVTEHNDWIAFCDWVPVEDIRRNPFFKNTKDIKATGSMDRKYVPPHSDSKNLFKADKVQVWKLFDIRKHVIHRWVAGQDRFLQEDDPWPSAPGGRPYLQLAFYRPHLDIESWLPIPPTTAWKAPQDELNETRQAGRVHRRRANRKFQIMEGSIDEEELDKITKNEDCSFIKIKRPDAIRAIEDAPLDRAVYANAPATKEDFNMISGTGGEQRAVPEAQTATQAQIIDINSKIRGSYSRESVAIFLSEIISLMLMTARDYMSLSWIQKITVDPTSPNAMVAQDRTATLWREITFRDIGDLDFEIAVDVESIRPVDDQTEKQDWLQVLQLFANPTLMMVLTQSETLLRKTMGYQNIRSDKEISEIRSSMQQLLSMIASQTASQMPGAPPNPGVMVPGPGGQPAAPGGPPPAQIMSALKAQMTGQTGRPS